MEQLTGPFEVDYASLLPLKRAVERDGIPLSATRNTRWWVMRRGAEVVAVRGLIQTTGGGMRLKALWVLPELRHQGVATRLIDFAIGVGQQACAPYLEVIVRPRAQAFYEARRFRLHATRPNGCVVLRRVL